MNAPPSCPSWREITTTSDYVSCCVRTVCGLFDDLPNFSVNSIGRGVRFINLMPKD